MTREQAKRNLEVIKAFAEGKPIQFRVAPKTDWITVSDTHVIGFDVSKAEYRIKPEPKLVPFTFEDAPLFRDKWVQHRNGGVPTKIIKYNISGVCAPTTSTIMAYFTYDEFVRLYVFTDTEEPCGKIVEE